MTITGQQPYAAALAAIQRFRQRIAPTGEQERRLAEISRRLLRLSVNFHRLMDINRKLTEQHFSEVHFDAETDMLEFSAGGRTRRLKLKRENPDRPIRFGGSINMGIFGAGADKSGSKEGLSLRVELEERLESYYQNAHQVQKLVTDVLKPKRKNKFECRPITMVRNRLIEHPRPEDQLVYSFGYGTFGPVVRPTAKSGEREWVDSGLASNTAVFDKALATAFDSVAMPVNAAAGSSTLTGSSS
jgi:hypothetical protein